MGRSLRLGLFCLATLICAGEALAETCTVSAGVTEWAAITDDIATDCTEDATDDFVIGQSAQAIITGDLALTSGSITVQAGGVLIQPCDQDISFATTDGGYIEVSDRGTFRRTGCVLSRDRIESIDWTTSDTTAAVTFKTNVADGAAIGDYMVVLDDGPEAFITDPPQTSAGNPEPGKYRPSYARLTWFRITAVSANVVTIAHDHTTDLTAKGGTFTDNPYEGTRGAAATGSGGNPTVSPLSVTIGRGQFASVLTFVAATDEIAGYSGDLGGQYVEWTTGACAGQLAKILWTTSGENDEVWVAGDATGCGTGAVRVHQGLRAGDPVAIVRPAEINYNQLGHFLWSGGRLEFEWTSDVRIGIIDGAAVPGQVYFSCSFCAYNGNLGNGSHSGFIRDARFGYPDEAAEDSYLLNFTSRKNNGDLRASGRYLDLGEFELSRIFIHDQEDDSVGNGGQHGIWTHSVKDFSARHIRTERMTDDGLGGIFEANGPGATGTFFLGDVLSYENDATNSNSQQCVDFRTRAHGDGMRNSFTFNRGPVIEGLACAGANDEAINLTMPTGVIDSVWAGGTESISNGGTFMVNNTTAAASTHCVGDGVPDPCCSGTGSGTCSWPLAYLRKAGVTTVRNSIKFGMGGDSSRASVTNARIEDSIWASSDAGTDETRNVVALVRTLLDSDGSAIMLNQSTTSQSRELWAPDDLLLNNAVMRTSVINGQVCSTGFATNAAATGLTFNLRVIDTALSFGAHRSLGVFDNCVEGAGAGGITIDGLWVADSDPTPLVHGISDHNDNINRVDNGRQVARACIEATGARDDPAIGYGPEAPSSAMHVYDLEPGGDHNVGLRSFVAQSVQGCESYKPKALGLSRIHQVHGMLGDLFLEQLDQFSSRDLP